MDPEIQRALADGVPPEAIAAELQKRGLPVPPQLVQLAQSRPQAQATDATATPKPPVGTASALPVLGAGALAAGGAGVAGKAGLDAIGRHRASALLDEGVQQSGGVQELIRKIEEYNTTGRGKLPTLADLDPHMGAVADFVATNNPSARVKLSGINATRRRGQPARLLSDVEQLAPSGYSSPKYVGELAKQSQADFAASPHGFQGLRDANPRIDPKASRELLTFTQSPELSSVWEDAAKAGLIGPKPADAPNSFAVLQDMKERLDDATSQAFKLGRGNLADRLKAARDQLRGLLEVSVPGYAQVSKQYGVMQRQRDAVERGVEVWNDHTIQLPDLQREMAGMSKEELTAYRQGVVGGYIRDIENAQTNRNLANQLMERSASTEKKLQLIFGNEENFKEAVKRIQLESSMSRLGEIVGGSQTARRGSAMADASEGVAEVGHAVLHPTTGIPAAGIKQVKKWFPGAIAKNLENPFTLEGSEELLKFLRSLPK